MKKIVGIVGVLVIVALLVAAVSTVALARGPEGSRNAAADGRGNASGRGGGQR